MKAHSLMLLEEILDIHPLSASLLVIARWQIARSVKDAKIVRLSLASQEKKVISFHPNDSTWRGERLR